jgi:voltage-gated potassium channel
LLGYGDLVPQTDLGKIFTWALMIMGYGIIAVPTGIVTVELANVTKNQTTRTCPTCMLEGHTLEGNFCRACGGQL